MVRRREKITILSIEKRWDQSWTLDIMENGVRVDLG